MRLEIERKFLVNGSDWREPDKATLYRQGYIFSEPGKNVRVRIGGDKAYLTVKKRISGLSRLEYEYEIPVPDAEELLAHACRNAVIEKYRYKIVYKNQLWEVDEFLGENAGLVLAEIELKNEDQPIDRPSWIGKEVTADKRYYNAYLSLNPFSRW